MGDVQAALLRDPDPLEAGRHGKHAMKHFCVLALALAAPLPAVAEALFVSCDNGRRCARAPCPSRDVVLLPSGKRYALTAPRLEDVSPADLRRLEQGHGLYEGTIVLGGIVEDGPPVRIVARRVVRAATAREAALCRRQATR
jgi:hypothetical protein